MAARRRGSRAGTGTGGVRSANRTVAGMRRMAQSGARVGANVMNAARQAIRNARQAYRRAGNAAGVRNLRNLTRRVGAGSSLSFTR